MDFQATLSALMPPPRDDEPASLRQDIVDELADHLSCAVRRELLRGLDPVAAQQRVLEQFGKPAAVARRLWVDAMRGRIMARRLVICTCLVMMLASFVVVRVAWLQAGRTAAESSLINRRMIEVLGRTQATSEEMMRHLQAMNRQTDAREAVSAARVAFRLMLEVADGPPALDYEVRLGRGYGASNNPDALVAVANERGVAEFVVDIPGTWEFTVTRSIGNTQSWTASGSISVAQGSGLVKEIICPRSPPETSPLTLRVDWPADLADQNLWLESQFIYTGLNSDPDLRLTWMIENTNHPNRYQARDFLVGPGSSQAEITDESNFYIWRLDEENPLAVPTRKHGAAEPKHFFADIPAQLTGPGQGSFDLETGAYRVVRLVVLTPLARPALTIEDKRFDVIAHAESVYGSPLTVHIGDATRNENTPAAVKDESQSDMRTSSVFVSNSSWIELEGKFQVEPGKTSEWVIKIPDELERAVRKALKIVPAAKTQPAGPVRPAAGN